MALTWEKRLPLIDAAGRKKVVERAQACAPQIAEKIGVSVDRVSNARLLGCGNYGCTLLLEGLPRDRAVIKVTSDSLEANAAARILEEGDAPDGIVKIHKVFRLGRCSVQPRMRPFTYREAREGRQVSWRGPGAPYRPLWVIQREELDDAWSHLKGRVKQSEVTKSLDVINTFAMDIKENWTSFGRPGRTRLAVSDEDLRNAAKKIHGEKLVEAIDWLGNADMSWLDMRKVINLGWREGTGLVIRDVGATEAGTDMLESIDFVGGARGQTKRRTRS